MEKKKILQKSFLLPEWKPSNMFKQKLKRRKIQVVSEKALVEVLKEVSIVYFRYLD